MPTPQKQRPGSSLARPSFPCSLSLVSFVCVTSFQHTPPRPISSPGKHGKSGLHFLIFLQRRTLFTESAWSSWWYLVFASSPQHPCIPPQVPCPLPAKPNENDFEALVGTSWHRLSGVRHSFSLGEGCSRRAESEDPSALHTSAVKQNAAAPHCSDCSHARNRNPSRNGRSTLSNALYAGIGQQRTSKKKTRPRLARRRRRRKRLCDCDISRSLPKPKQQTHRHK